MYYTGFTSSCRHWLCNSKQEPLLFLFLIFVFDIILIQCNVVSRVHDSCTNILDPTKHTDQSASLNVRQFSDYKSAVSSQSVRDHKLICHFDWKKTLTKKIAVIISIISTRLDWYHLTAVFKCCMLWIRKRLRNTCKQNYIAT